MAVFPLQESATIGLKPGDAADTTTAFVRLCDDGVLREKPPTTGADGCLDYSEAGLDVAICDHFATYLPDDAGGGLASNGPPSAFDQTTNQRIACQHGLYRFRQPDGTWCLWADRAPRPVCLCSPGGATQTVELKEGTIPIKTETITIEAQCYPLVLRASINIKEAEWEASAFPYILTANNTVSTSAGFSLNDFAVMDPNCRILTSRVGTHVESREIRGPCFIVPAFQSVTMTTALSWVQSTTVEPGSVNGQSQLGNFTICFDGWESTQQQVVWNTPTGF